MPFTHRQHLCWFWWLSGQGGPRACFLRELFPLPSPPSPCASQAQRSPLPIRRQNWVGEQRELPACQTCPLCPRCVIASCLLWPTGCMSTADTMPAGRWAQRAWMIHTAAGAQRADSSVSLGGTGTPALRSLEGHEERRQARGAGSHSPASSDTSFAITRVLWSSGTLSWPTEPRALGYWCWWRPCLEEGRAVPGVSV